MRKLNRFPGRSTFVYLFERSKKHSDCIRDIELIYHFTSHYCNENKTVSAFLDRRGGKPQYEKGLDIYKEFVASKAKLFKTHLKAVHGISELYKFLLDSNNEKL